VESFESITGFHESTAKELEISHFLNAFSLLSSEQQQFVVSYMEGENKEQMSAGSGLPDWTYMEVRQSWWTELKIFNHFPALPS